VQSAKLTVHLSLSPPNNTDIAFYDLPNMKMYVSFASPFGVAGPVRPIHVHALHSRRLKLTLASHTQAPAYARQYTAWDVSRLLNETQ
jgi:hypothetical protein